MAANAAITDSLARSNEIRRVAERHGATNVRISGSFARGEARPESDLDLLVALAPGRSPFDLIAIKQELEDLLGRTVDVHTDRGLNPYIRDRVLRVARPLGADAGHGKGHGRETKPTGRVTMKERDETRLRHILDAIARIEQYVAVGYERFMTEPMRQDAVIRQQEIIGEATKCLSPDFRARHPEVHWRGATGMRDVLIHNYPDVDLDVDWRVAREEVPALKRHVEAILASDYGAAEGGGH